MDMNNVAQLMNGLQTNQTQQQNNVQSTQSAIPGTPAAPATPVTLPGTVDVVDSNNSQFQPDMDRVRELWNNHQTQVDSFRRMMETLLNQQAERQGLSQGWSLREIEVTDEMRAEAAEMVADGGYFSVDATAGRILDFAVALSGGDPGRIDVLRDAVERAFTQAERMFGGELPEISHQTLEAVRNGFDEWAAAGSASAISLLQQV